MNQSESSKGSRLKTNNRVQLLIVVQECNVYVGERWIDAKSQNKNNQKILYITLKIIIMASTGCPRKNVPFEDGQTTPKGTFFLGHLVS